MGSKSGFWAVGSGPRLGFESAPTLWILLLLCICVLSLPPVHMGSVGLGKDWFGVSSVQFFFCTLLWVGFGLVLENHALIVHS
jgi:hypothetical protein